MTSLIQEYKKYVTGHVAALEMLTEKLESNSLFADFHRVTMFSAEAKQQSLQAYLIMPVQRVPRYILFLEDIKVIALSLSTSGSLLLETLASRPS